MRWWIEQNSGAAAIGIVLVAFVGLCVVSWIANHPQTVRFG